MDITTAKRLSYDTKFKYVKGIDTVKWTDVYTSEQEIIDDLKQVHIPTSAELETITAYGPLYTGYEYIHSFAKTVQSGKELTKKQLTQCKRLAVEIKRAVAIRECY